MSDHKNNFSGFEPLSKEAWKSLALADLKGADFEEQLVWKTYEGFSVEPYYAKEDTEDKPVNTLPRRHPWKTYQEIMVDDADQANKEAHIALSFDVGSIVFKVNESISITKLLAGIDPQKTEVSFSGNKAIQATHDYFDYLPKQKIPLDKISGFCDHDIMGKWITSDADLNVHELVDLIKKTESATSFKVIHIHSGDFINAGSNFTQELAFTMNKMVEYIDQLTESKLNVKQVIENLSLEMAITSDFFFEVAKIHAVKSLYPSILKAYGVEGTEIPIMASSSLWSKSRYDKHVNMIRNTSEAMSAVLSGCDRLLIRRHDMINDEPSDFSQRIAANISNLLREESYLDKIDNPVSGSYYVEWLTSQLIQSSLDLFKKTEKNGGLVEGIKSGTIQQEIKAIKRQKELDLIEGRFTMIGTNKYRIESENVPEPSRPKNKAADGRELLSPQCLGDLYRGEKTAIES